MTGASCNGWFADNWLPVVRGNRLRKVRAERADPGDRRCHGAAGAVPQQRPAGRHARLGRPAAVAALGRAAGRARLSCSTGGRRRLFGCARPGRGRRRGIEAVVDLRAGRRSRLETSNAEQLRWALTSTCTMDACIWQALGEPGGHARERRRDKALRRRPGRGGPVFDRQAGLRSGLRFGGVHCPPISSPCRPECQASTHDDATARFRDRRAAVRRSVWPVRWLGHAGRFTTWSATMAVARDGRRRKELGLVRGKGRAPRAKRRSRRGWRATRWPIVPHPKGYGFRRSRRGPAGQGHPQRGRRRLRRDSSWSSGSRPSAWARARAAILRSRLLASSPEATGRGQVAETGVSPRPGRRSRRRRWACSPAGSFEPEWRTADAPPPPGGRRCR